MKVVALAGGVGGAKLADGLARVLPADALTVIVNTADDFEHLGLRISPDIDTVCYTLAGIANRKTGWGIADDTWHCLSALAKLGGPDWFRLGDKDLGTHLERTRRLRQGQRLSEVVRAMCGAWDIRCTVLPMTDDHVATFLDTDAGQLSFQEYFVHRNFQPRVERIWFDGIATAKPAPGVLDALASADAIVICPSNPWVSIAPILALRGVRKLVAGGNAAAVSPIVGGRALKGPADKMYVELGRSADALQVALDYEDCVRNFVLDRTDSRLEGQVRDLGFRVLVTDTIMHSRGSRKRLAEEVLAFLQEDCG